MRDGDAIRLTIREPSGGEREARLEQDVIRIGRARDCDLALESGYISRYHARLERSGEDWELVDEGSKNGVILNGRRVSGRHALFSGDTIRLGDFTLIFHLPDTQDEDRTIIYPFAAAELDAQLHAARGGAALQAEPPLAAPGLVGTAPTRPAASDREERPIHVAETKPTPANPPPPSLDRRELAVFTQLTAAGESGADTVILGDATWSPGAWDAAMLERLVARLDGKLRRHDERGVVRDPAGRYRIAHTAGVG